MAKKPFDIRSGTRKDAKGKVLRKPKDNAMGDSANFKWWTVEENEMAAAIAGTLKFIQRHQSPRIEQLTISTRLYGSTSAYNLMGAAFTRASLGTSNPSMQRISYNLCSSIVDTLESKMAKNKVIPTYITNGAMWDVQKKAKDLTKFTQGLFHELNAHELTIGMFGDGAVWGDGFLHPYRTEDDKVAVERVLPHEIWVDQIESMVTEPTTLHRVKLMDRDVALSMFTDLKENIEAVAPANYQDVGGQGTAADLVTVVESWHLRSGPKAKDGMRVISIGDGVLKDKWDKDYFPFVHFRYSKRKLGWYGQGAPERLQNLQGEINRGMILKQRSLHMMASFKILLENGSKVVTQHLNNEIGSLIHYTGTAPQYVTPPATNPELQQWIDSLIEKGYQQEGVSRLATTGEAPLGVESGKAMRTLTQIGDDRFLFMSQQMEDATLELARQSIDIVKEIYKDKGSYEAVFPEANFMETVDWKNIDLEADKYVLKAYPTSSLSDDLTGRLSEIQELMQAGLVSPRTGKRLMDMPDVEMNDNLSDAAENNLHKALEKMLYDGVFTPPDQFKDLTLAKTLSLQYYNYAEFMNCPDDRLALVRNFLTQIDDIIQHAQAAMAPPPGAPMPGGQPMAAPMPTPQSNLIQNTPQGAM